MDDVTLALEAFAYATLDDASGSVALLSRDGRIMAVNRAWREHAEQCGADMGTVGPGTDYLEVCTRSAAAGCEDARLALDGLHAVLDGRSDSFRFTYDFSFAGRPRWVELSARRLPGIGGPGVAHRHHRRARRAEGIRVGGHGGAQPSCASRRISTL